MNEKKIKKLKELKSGTDGERERSKRGKNKCTQETEGWRKEREGGGKMEKEDKQIEAQF